MPMLVCASFGPGEAVPDTLYVTHVACDLNCAGSPDTL